MMVVTLALCRSQPGPEPGQSENTGAGAKDEALVAEGDPRDDDVNTNEP